MTKKKGIKIEDFLNNDIAIPDDYKELLRGIKSPMSEHELILSLLSITVSQSIKIKDLEREMSLVKNYLCMLRGF